MIKTRGPERLYRISWSNNQKNHKNDKNVQVRYYSSQKYAHDRIQQLKRAKIKFRIEVSHPEWSLVDFGADSQNHVGV